MKVRDLPAILPQLQASDAALADAINETADEIIIRPQPGPQEDFLSTSADICVYGGSAGGGKSFGLLLECLRNVTDNPNFAAVVFRRNTVQVKNPGGLWDESLKLFPDAGGTPVAHVLEWRWNPTGGIVKFAHLEHDKSVLDWQGSQIPLIGFDELTHFTRAQFFYMLSRNRSMCGVKPYIRATTNPDADSWVAEFISWWIDQETGYAIPERSGVVRWFIRLSDKIIWADSRQELMTLYGRADLPEDHEEQVRPKSFTFIAASIYDNKILLKQDPDYLANLQALPAVERARLLGGNWKIRPSAGLYFKREWVEEVAVAPVGLKWVRYWDLASTEKTDDNDPDWTVGVKMAKDSDGTIYVEHMTDMRVSPGKVEKALLNTATQDGRGTRVGLPQDPGQAGKSQVVTLVKLLHKFTVSYRRENGDKVQRFGPFSSQAQAGNVKIVVGLGIRPAWVDRYYEALEAFPEAAHDDHADATSGAYGQLTPEKKGSILVKSS